MTLRCLRGLEDLCPDTDCVSVSALDYGVWTVPNLERFLDCPVVVEGFRPAATTVRACVGWGLKKSGLRAARRAARMAVPCLRLEDGFLRSVGLGKKDPPLSLVIDDLGIYYDATRPSRLESLIPRPLSPAEKQRAASLLAAWRTARVSKYNHAREVAPPPDREIPSSPYVLVVDQTVGDASIHYGLAASHSFQAMLAAALAENPDCTIVLKVHPEVLAGRKQAHFDLATLRRNPRLRVLGQDVHPVALIEGARALYVVTSQMGFEGLLWGKRVRTFGMPFYAGWGLTQDELPPPVRRKPVCLENLVHAALVAYPRYLDPETGLRCEPERLLAWMGLQRRQRERFPATVYATGFSRYKRGIVRNFFQGSEVRFVRREDRIPAGAVVAVWGRRKIASPQPRPFSPEAGIGVVRLEDGFLRSVGLGADLIRPLSWVMDTRGIYYDAGQPSDLEHLLQTALFAPETLARAGALRQRIVAEGLTKYNVGAGSWQRPTPVAPVILVPGQVETDASLAFGAPGIRTNLALLQAVRKANSGAYLIYKPHPDVVAGLRKKGKHEEDAAGWCDEIVTACSMDELLAKVDEVHVLTSLAGFEALLRGKAVTCYGHPFYAGWGLTADIMPMPRRSRKLSLDELVAATLLLYPTYLSRTTGKFTTPERALDELLAWRKSAGPLPWWRKVLRFFLWLRRS